MKAGGALAVGAHLPGPWMPRAAAQAAPLRLGFQVHRTGIGAVYGRWYERTTAAAVKLINEKGGIGGRPVEIVAEDDGTDPKRGAEVVEKLAPSTRWTSFSARSSRTSSSPRPRGRGS